MSGSIHSDWLVPDWPVPTSVRAVCSTRAGGVSLPPYGSLNLGDHVNDEPAAVAFPEVSEVNANFRKLAQSLLTGGNYPALATHDERLITEVVRFAEKRGIGKDGYEMQMLYGIRRDLQARLVAQGHRVRIYVPFGVAWYPYFMRRLAERPANVYFVLRNLFR